jgi:ribonuclease HI
MYELYTDGACKNNPGPAGWAFLVRYPNGLEATMVGGMQRSTNNRAELKAVIEGLKYIPDGGHVQIFTDSEYVITVSSSANTKLKNWDMVKELREEVAKHQCTFHHIKGHSGHKENEQVDKLASDAAFSQIVYS